MEELPWHEIERIVRRDPACRGVASYLDQGQPLLSGHLALAARDMAQSAQAVAIVTGFCILTPQGIAAETDGPPGALFLARALLALGIDVALLSDAYGVPVLRAGCDCWQLPRGILQEIPFEDPSADHPSRSNDPPHNVRTDRWVDEFLAADFGRRLTHLVAIERVGPSHTLDSVTDVEAFAAAVPPEHRNVCHNMRGDDITVHTAKAHRLFERIAQQRLPIKTIGIGDGGNEIGLGSIPWQTLRRAIHRGPADFVPCRVASDYAILAGVSNWGGYALALSVLALRRASQLATLWDAADLRRLIETLVRESFCVDGVTKQRQPTVDGMPLETYLETFAALRQAAVGFR
jgi:hypothetical protein